MQFREIASKGKRVFTDCAINLFWKFDVQGAFPGILLGRFNKNQRQLVKANWLALKGESELAGKILSELILRNPCERSAVISLGSLLSQVGLENPISLWSKLRASWLLIDKPEKINSKNFPFFALGVDLALRYEPELAERAIKNIYFSFIWNYERVDKQERDSILYWHVPKTGGTSVNSTLSRAWYESGTRYLPSYTTPRFFAYVAKHQDGVLPYLSSSHLSALDIGVTCLGSYRKILVLRDPEKRALSAWRQYRENPAARLYILPQHGAVWDFFPVCDLGDWTARAPRNVVNPLEWTFSGFGNDIGSGIDDVIPLEDLANGGERLAQEMGLKLEDVSFKTEKNVTNKKILPSPSDVDLLGKACHPDAKLYKLFQTKVKK